MTARWRCALVIALLSATSTRAFANSDLIPPTIETKTPTGISLSDGSFTFTRTDLSIGTLKLERFYRAPVSTYTYAASGRVDASKMFHGLHSSNNFDIFVMPAARRNAPNHTPYWYARPIVHIGDSASAMYVQYSFAAGSSVSANTPDASAGKLEWIGWSGSIPRYRYTDASGTVYNFHPSVTATGVTETAKDYDDYAQRIENIQYPDGRVRSFSYVSQKLKLVTDSTGYAIVFDWNAAGYISAACGFNLSQTYVSTSTTCDGQALKVTYTYTGADNNLLATVTDVLNQDCQPLLNPSCSERYEYNDRGTMSCLKPPGSLSCAISNVWTGGVSGGTITQTLADGNSWLFEVDFYDQSAGGRKTEFEPYGDGNVAASVTDPDEKTWVYGFTGSAPLRFIDPMGKNTLYEHQANAATPYDEQFVWPEMHNGTTLIQATLPEGMPIAPNETGLTAR